MAIERFEDLIAWQRARELVREVYRVSRVGVFAKDFGLSRQIQRAAVSIMSNVAEGFDRKGDREFRQFLSIAKGSCAEVRSLVYVAVDAGYLTREDARPLILLAQEVSRIVTGLRSSIVRGRPSQADMTCDNKSNVGVAIVTQDLGLRTQDLERHA